jgi:hypothetical protein
LEYGKFALFYKKFDVDNHVTRDELLKFPKGDKRHRILSFPKANAYKMPNSTLPRWTDQWGVGIAKYLIELSTKRGETIGDFYCGTGTIAYWAIRMGRNVIAVDVLEEAIKITNNRLTELRALVEDVPFSDWAHGSNPMSSLAGIPNWSTRDLVAVGQRERARDAQIKKNKELKRKRDRAQEKQDKAKEVAQGKKVDAQLKKVKQDIALVEAEEALKKATQKLGGDDSDGENEATESLAKINDEKDEEEEDEEDKEKEKEEVPKDPTSDEEEEEESVGDDEINIGFPTPTPPVTPATTRSKGKGGGENL